MFSYLKTKKDKSCNRYLNLEIMLLRNLLDQNSLKIAKEKHFDFFEGLVLQFKV